MSADPLPFAVLIGLLVAVLAWAGLESRARYQRRMLALVQPSASTSGAQGAASFRPPKSLSRLGRHLPTWFHRIAGGYLRFEGPQPPEILAEWRDAGVAIVALLIEAGLALSALVDPAWSLATVVAAVAVRFFVGQRLRSEEMERRRILDRELTAALDVIVLGLEAGLPFESAVAEYCKSSASSLARELSITSGEFDVGYRRAEALQRLVARTRSPGIASLVSSVRLAEELGTPLASALRGLAVELRADRRQRLQAAALRAPVTMLLPTAGFILVPIFAIVLGPIVIRLVSGTLL